METKVTRTVQFLGEISKEINKAYLKVLEDYAEKWDTDIVFCVCHGKYEVVPPEMSFDKFYIFVQLLPKEFEGVKKHTIKSYKFGGKEMLFPIKEDASQKCPQGDTLIFTKAPERAQIIRDDEGIAVAVIHDGSLYILNDFVHCRSLDELKSSMKIFHHIIDEAVNKTDVLKHLKSGVEEKSKRALEAALRIQFTQRLDKEVVQLKATKDTITQYEKGIVGGTRKALATERIIEAIHRNISDVPTALNKTWKSIEKMKNGSSYEKISFTRTGIKAVTTPIFVRFENREYDLGQYEVNLNFEGGCRILSTNRKVEHFDHPHINDGTVCWGNFAGYIPKLIGASEFDVALVQIYTFLCHYDSGNPYKSIDHWPLKKKITEQSEELKVRV